eukprot:m.341084 g.341084  ORF g.341084 m.341084 type:complete len:641 (+) comp19802_c0_seq1:132-2054(+)
MGASEEENSSSQDGAAKEVQPDKNSKENEESEFPEVPYQTPSWAANPKDDFKLEVLKNGTIVEEISLSDKSKDRYIIGRLPNCDIVLEHPSISRYHAVLQHGDDGYLYIYDLGSTHRTKLNKTPVTARKYYRIKVGFVVRFGMSSRMFVLQGSEKQTQEEDARLAQVEDKIIASREKRKIIAERKEARGISWGMDEDDLDSDAAALASATKGEKAEKDDDSYFQEDPRKWLTAFFDRENCQIEFEIDQEGPSHARTYICRIRLPAEGDEGEPLVAEASVMGKKKDAKEAACMAACKILHERKLLKCDEAAITRKAQRKKKIQEDNSDDDSFYDRTGDVEAKKRRRMKRAQNKTETKESLTAKKKALLEELNDIKTTMQRKKEKSNRAVPEGVDPLDAFMSSMKATVVDESLTTMKKREREIRVELGEVEELLALVAPALAPVHVEKTEIPPQVDNANESDSKQESSSKTNEQQTTTAKPTEPVKKQSNVAKIAKIQNSKKAENTNKPVEEKGETKEAEENAPESREAKLVAKLKSVYAEKEKTRKKNTIKEEWEEAKDDNKFGGLITKKKSKKRKMEVEMEEPPVKRTTIMDSLDAPEEPQMSMSEKLALLEAEEKSMRWKPPKNQTGDGRTSLNDKLGY